jgi:hypothetical protein
MSASAKSGTRRSRMDNLKPKKPILRLVKEDETLDESKPSPAPISKPKSAFASQMTNFADDLDAQIALLLNS